MKQETIETARLKVLHYLDRAGIKLTPQETTEIEITDLGLNRLDEIGLGLLVYVNTSRVCAKELVLFPHQICPEHKHPAVEGEPGKEETFRCRWGQVYLYVPGPTTPHPKGRVPDDKKEYFTVWHQIILNPGEQYTLAPQTLHWFQGGAEGAVVSEFSTTSRDPFDIFTDPEIRRVG
ncbi:MAG: D-lyxose/D-mannose family sugar isomerase [Calditrichaeota bacterium]|nr:MAG: D-lyxose/D-mannose family sugar isomerase [Calditrichota bacterium]